MATMRRYNALANATLADEPIARNALFPARRNRERMLGTTSTTSGQNPQQVANQAAFDRSMGFRVNGAPAIGALASKPADPYALDYAENYSGTFGSQRNAATAPLTQRPIPRAIPVAPGTTGIAVRAVGNSMALDAAGASTGPALNQVAYKPTAPEPAAFTPNNVYTAPAPTFTPSPTPGPAATGATLPSAPPGSTPIPTATPAMTPTPTATPTIQPTPIESAGRLAAAGVSNSQAAGFEQPTAQNPIPKTPTSPILDANDFDSRKKNKFTGF